MLTPKRLGFWVTVAIAGACTRVFAADASSKLEQGLSLLEASDYDAAEKALKTAQAQASLRGAARVGLAKAELATGKYAEAAKTAASAQADRSTQAEASGVRGEALARQGKTAEAIAVLEAVKADPNARRARLLLGELYIETGRRADAQDPLMTIVSDYNQNLIKPTDVDGLTLVGRAAHLLRSARDANDAYNQAEKAGKPRVEMLLYRADLFLEKYDPGHAEEVVKEALKIAPHNAAAHVAMAHVKLDQALDFESADHEIEQALAVDPKMESAFFVAAGLALRTMDLARADQLIDRGLSTNPSALALLSMKAAVRFLSDDKPGFEKLRQTVFAKNAEYTRFYQIVGEFADWEHRYDEIVAMMREAVKIDPADAKAWADLGMNLIRAGDEQGGVTALRRAWDKDHFNVRVYNTLNLYEKEIATSYETVEGTPFRIRYPKDEKPILVRYLPAMLHEAWASMVKRYGFSPTTPVFIELYASKQSFSVRTSGLPNVGIQGVCFGKTLAAMSPRRRALQLGQRPVARARPRVRHPALEEPRAALVHRGAQRVRDDRAPARVAARGGPLALCVSRGRQDPAHRQVQPGVHPRRRPARRHDGVLRGEPDPALPRELVRYAEDRRDAQAMGRGQANRRRRPSRARDHHHRARPSRRRLAPIAPRALRHAVRPRYARSAARRRQGARRTRPEKPKKQVELALALAAEHKLDDAEAAIKSALAENPIEPNAHFLRARILRAKKNSQEARQELVGMVRSGYDGFAVRMLLADLAAEAKNDDDARFEFLTAHEFDPTMSEPLAALYDIDHRQKREAEALGWLRKIAKLDQHDRKAYRLLLEGLVRDKQFSEARAVGEAAIFVDVESHAIHSLYATALAETGDHAKAVFELESALACSPRPPEAATLHARLAKEHLAMGNRVKAKADQAEALRLDPANAEAAALKIP